MELLELWFGLAFSAYLAVETFLDRRKAWSALFSVFVVYFVAVVIVREVAA